MIRLTSSKNPVVKEIRSLRNKSDRQEKGLYFIEGIRFVGEALNEHATSGRMPGIRYLIVSESFASDAGSESFIEPCINRGIKVYCMPDSLLSLFPTQRIRRDPGSIGYEKGSPEGCCA